MFKSHFNKLIVNVCLFIIIHVTMNVAVTVYPSGTLEFTPGLQWGSWLSIFSFVDHCQVFSFICTLLCLQSYAPFNIFKIFLFQQNGYIKVPSQNICFRSELTIWMQKHKQYTHKEKTNSHTKMISNNVMWKVSKLDLVFIYKKVGHILFISQQLV